uniref:Bm8505 n=1 Tax=Brugia malayi TaxID=6279 RepID=A0A1I9G6I3_BRUMA|nr:Bm8505 [Brugia malayi]
MNELKYQQLPLIQLPPPPLPSPSPPSLSSSSSSSSSLPIPPPPRPPSIHHLSMLTLYHTFYFVR